ncbi:MAG: molybdopterin-dependent oxidoreductase [Anaerolineales bacterium]
MILRFVNTSMLVLITLLTVTGVYGIVWVFPGWMYELHRAFGWALIALIPWKAAISLRSLGRGLKVNVDRGVIPVISVALSAATLLVFALGVMWAWRLEPRGLFMNQTLISWHWILALVIIAPFLLHSWWRWPRPKQADFVSRGGFLRIAGIAAAGAVGWGASRALASRRADPAMPRAASGSRLNGYLTGNDFPITNSVGDGRLPVAIDTWSLQLLGAVEKTLVFSYEEVLALPQQTITATIDCTVGWWSVQRWQGVALSALLAEASASYAARSVRLGAVSGHVQLLPMSEAVGVLLATHVGGSPIAHEHGFPLRAVVPSRRGWFWVKWLSEIEVVT